MLVTRVLVVDDSAQWQRFVQEIFESQPDLKIVGTAADGLEAVQKAVDLRPDVILMDLCLPLKNGFEATNEIRTLRLASRVLFLTEQNDPDFIEAAFQAGALGYVLKSDSFSDLFLAIRTIRRGEEYVSRSLKGWRNGVGQ